MIDKDKKTPGKIIRLVDYLSALTRINTRIVRTFDDYRKILWVHDIPHEPKYCFTQAWGQEDEHDDEVWIEVNKFQEPELPKIPQKCADWVKHETLRNTKDLPELYNSIVVERKEEDPETGEEFTVVDTLYLRIILTFKSLGMIILKNTGCPGQICITDMPLFRKFMPIYFTSTKNSRNSVNSMNWFFV